MESPSRPLREVRTCPQLERLNDILVGCQRQGFSWYDDGLEEALASSACSTVSPGSRPGLKRQVWSLDFSSTAPSDPGVKEYSHKDVPRRAHFQSEPLCEVSSGSRELPTTLMIRNIPNRYSQQDLLEELEELGFAGLIDFVYLPRDKSAKASIGYAFVNFADGASAQRCMDLLPGHTFSRCGGKGRRAQVSVAHMQGVDANLAHYERSAVNSSRRAQHRPLFLPV